MRTHTSNFKNKIKELGREIDSKITYGNNIIASEDLYSISPILNGELLKSVMKELDFESSIQIPQYTVIKYEFGLKVDGEYEYLNYGNYIVYSSEYNEDTRTYEHICYDSMLYTMKEYTTLQNGTFPMTVREYLTNLCLDCNLVFKNANDTFANYNKTIETDLYANLGYTYRDIFDELSQVTASSICTDSNNMVEVRYINETNDTIDEEYLKDINVKFGEKYGPINSIVLSRSGESDNVFLRDEDSVSSNGICELKIIDNQIMNFNDRSDYLTDILARLNGLEYFLNDYSSTGILYYEMLDKYNVKIGDNTYPCILFNDEPKITQGLVENIYTELPEESVTDYTKADKTDRRINQAYILVDKQNQKIEAIVETQEDQSSKITKLQQTDEQIKASVESIDKQIIPTASVSGSNTYIEDASDDPLIQLEIEGKSTQTVRSGKNKFPIAETQTINGVTLTKNNNGTFNIKGTAIANAEFSVWLSYEKSKLDLMNGKTYSLSHNIENNDKVVFQVSLWNGTIDNATWVKTPYQTYEESTKTFNYDTVGELVRFTILINSGVTVDLSNVYVQLGEEENKTEFEQYGASPSSDYPSEIESVGYENLFDHNYFYNNYVTATNSNAGRCVYQFKPNTKYTISTNCYGASETAAAVFAVSGNNTSFTPSTTNNGILTNKTITTDENGYLTMGIYVTGTYEKTIEDFENGSAKIQITEGVIEYPYIPFGKYGIEVKTVGKNLFNIKDNLISSHAGLSYIYNENGSFLINGTSTGTWAYVTNVINEELQVDTYAFSIDTALNHRIYLALNLEDGTTSSQIIETGDTSKIFTLTQKCTSYRVIVSNLTSDNTYSETIFVMLEKSSTATKYEPYQSNTSVIVLNEPLRSLPNGVKDIAYIKNNRLYVNRKVGSRIFDGNETWKIQETWSAVGELTNAFYTSRTDDMNMASGKNKLSSYFIYKPNLTSIDEEGFFVSTNIVIRVPKTITSVDELKTWLSSNNVQIDYELAEPYTEELGEIKMPSTYKGVNHILTTDELEPTINLEYVRDTTLSNYVEGQINKVITIEKRDYSELVIENNLIKESVTEINSNLSDMTEDIHTVQETITSTEKTIDIISTNIDKTTGEIREVTTINGYKFNKDGLNIYTNENSFNTLIDNEGTYYKDGDTIISETTKDGFMATSIKNKGSEEYCYDETNKVYDFVKERIEVDGAYGYATFYNGVN